MMNFSQHDWKFSFKNSHNQSDKYSNEQQNKSDAQQEVYNLHHKIPAVLNYKSYVHKWSYDQILGHLNEISQRDIEEKPIVNDVKQKVRPFRSTDSSYTKHSNHQSKKN